MTTTKHSLNGKVALITGASSGIGVGIAVLFARLGSQVALTGRDEENLRKTAAECASQPDAKQPFVVVGDLTKADDARRIVASTVDHFGRLDVLVNNAGVATLGTAEAGSMDDYDYVMDINVRAVFQLTSLAIPHLLKSKGASVVNVSSMLSERAINNWAVYFISKAAMDQYTRSLALELAEKKIRVNSVNPSVTITAVHEKMGFGDEERKALYKRRAEINPLGRLCETMDVAQGVAFLASDDASFITGVHLRIDGGYMLQCAA